MNQGLHKKLWGSQIRQNLVSGAATSVITVVINLVAVPLYLAYLGLETYGLWVLLMVTLQVVQLLDPLVGNPLIRYLAQSQGRDAPQNARDYLSTAVLLAAACGLGLSILLLLGQGPFARLLGVGESPLAAAVLPWLALLVLAQSLAVVLASALSGWGRMDLVNLNAVAALAVQTAVTLGLLAGGLGIWAMYLGMILYNLMIIAGSLWLLRGTPILELRAGYHPGWAAMKGLLAMGSKQGLAQALTSLAVEVPARVLLGRWFGLDMVAAYEVVTKLIIRGRDVLARAFRALLHHHSFLESQGPAGVESSLAITRRLQGAILLASLPGIALVWLVGQPLLSLWLGSQYHPLMPTILVLLSLGYLPNLLVLPAAMAIIGWGATGAYLLVAIINCLVFLLGAALDWYLGHPWGALGLVAAYGAGMLAGASAGQWFFLRLVQAKRQVREDS